MGSVAYSGPLFEPKEVSEETIGAFWTLANLATIQRCFWVSDSGHVGLGSAYTAPGDLIVMLCGALLPFVIRRCGTNDTYQLLGPASGFRVLEDVLADLDFGVKEKQLFRLC